MGCGCNKRAKLAVTSVNQAELEAQQQRDSETALQQEMVETERQIEGRIVRARRGASRRSQSLTTLSMPPESNVVESCQISLRTGA